MMRTPAIVIGLAGASLCAQAQETAIERYRASTGPHLVLCAQTVEIAELKARLNKPLEPKDNPMECITKARADAAKAYAGLAKTLKNKPAALNALKTTQAAFMTAIQGVMPDDGEVRIAYRTRMSAQRARFQETMERLRLEL